mgnify:CR=1 FL=1
MLGYDSFFEKPGVVKERTCLVCGTICSVKRDQLGPTSWGGAMAHKVNLHDFFYCPHMDEDWHEQASELLQSIEDTPSKRLAGLMKLDLEDLIKENL